MGLVLEQGWTSLGGPSLVVRKAWDQMPGGSPTSGPQGLAYSRHWVTGLDSSLPGSASLLRDLWTILSSPPRAELGEGQAPGPGAGGFASILPP